MKFLSRAAAVAAVVSASTLAAAGAPGLAIAPDKPLISLPVITSESIVSPQNVATPENVPAPKTQADPAAADAQDDAETEDRADFASLAAAVAARSDTTAISNDLECMAGAVYFEAKGEPLTGQLAVAQVILNRSESGRFPKSICSVVTQHGQFSFIRGGRIPAINRSSSAYRRALAVARVAMDGLWDSQAGNALYFHATHVSPGWRMARVAAIGRHVFYR